MPDDDPACTDDDPLRALARRSSSRDWLRGVA
jgi:hypothetical protein